MGEVVDKYYLGKLRSVTKKNYVASIDNCGKEITVIGYNRTGDNCYLKLDHEYKTAIIGFERSGTFYSLTENGKIEKGYWNFGYVFSTE